MTGGNVGSRGSVERGRKHDDELLHAVYVRAQ